MGQCGVQRSHHQPGTCRPEKCDDEVGVIGADNANRVPSAQPRGLQAVGHVVDHCGEFAIGDRDSITSDHQGPGVRSIMRMLIEEIEKSTDRRGFVRVRVTNRRLGRSGHDRHLLSVSVVLAHR